MLTRAIVLAILAGITGLVCKYSPEVRGGGEPGVIMKLPDSVAGMTGETIAPDPVEKKLLPADTEFAKATYRTSTSDVSTRDVVHCSIVLSGSERKSIHRPEVCLQGQGWSLLQSRVLPVNITQGRKLLVNDLYISKNITLRDGTRRQLRAHYFYWFVGQDVTTPSHAERIWLTLRDNVTRGVNHRWAYATTLALVTDNFTSQEIGERSRDSEATIALLEKFIRSLAPRFQKSFMDNPPVAAAN